MINVIDRQPRKPNRVRLISETDGSSKFYVIDRADEPIIQGTPLNKALFDSIDTDLKNRYTKTEADNNVNNKLKGYYDKPQMDVMLSERNMIKKNLSVTPITNTDSTTNVMYPFKYTLPFEHVTAEDIAEASIAINTECPEFQGTNTINGAVELLFNDQPKSPVLFSYVSVSNAKGTTDTLIQRVADIENNKNNITTNTQDITKLKNDINTLSNIKADGIICTTENKLINVKDSSNSAFNEFNVYGESSQITTKGYQLFDASKIPTKTQGGVTVTNNGDGSFTISGSGNTTSEFNTNSSYTKEEALKMLKVGVLKINAENIEPFCFFKLNYTDGKNEQITTHTNRNTLTVTQEMLNKLATIDFGFYVHPNSPIKQGTFKPMVYQDGDGTWEPFTGGKPSPSPDNPQEIVNKTVNEVKVTGKNLVGKNAKYITYGSGVGWILNRNDVVLPFKPTSETYGIGYTVMCEKGKSYTISVTNPNENAVVGITEYLSIEDMYNLTKKIGFAYPTPNKATYTAKTNGFLLCFIAGKWTDGSTTTHICTDTELLQVEVGSSPTPYEPYKEQKVTLSQPITLCGLKSEQGNVTIDGQKYISDVITEKNGVYGVERFINETVLKTVKEVSKPSWTECVNCSSWNCLLDKIHAKDGASVMSKMNILPNVYDNRDNEHFFVTDRIEKNVTLFILDSRLKSVDVKGANEWLLQNKPNIIYPLETPTFEPLPIADQQALKQLHSFYPNTIITNNDNAFMKLNYVADTKMYIDNKIAEIVNQKVV